MSGFVVINRDAAAVSALMNESMAATVRLCSTRAGITVTVGYADGHYAFARGSGRTYRESCVRAAIESESALYWDGSDSGFSAGRAAHHVERKRRAGTMGIGWARESSTASINAGPEADRYSLGMETHTQWRGVYTYGVWIPRVK